MDNISSIRAYVKNVQVLSLVSGGIISTALMLWVSHSAGLGLFSGVVISVVNFKLMATDAFLIVQKNPGKARKFILGRYLLRYAIMFVFLALVVTRTNLNVLAAFIGLFFVQIHLFIIEIYKATKTEKIS